MSDYKKEINSLVSKGLLGVTMDKWKPKYYVTDLGEAVQKELEAKQKADAQHAKEDGLDEFLAGVDKDWEGLN